VERAAVLLRAPARLEERVVLVERAVLDGAIDAHEVLVDDPSGAEVRVADLGVPHLPLRQADRQPARLDGGVGELPHEGVHVRGARHRDGVRVALGADAPTIEDNEENGLWPGQGSLRGGSFRGREMLGSASPRHKKRIRPAAGQGQLPNPHPQ
jgi:hypothetical protein